MKKNNPMVSIIIPVYNGEDYVAEAIDSALKQTYENLEIIVVNDGSIDNTDEVCRSYGNKIKYYRKNNGGVATALNYGIDKMSGDYFSWLSHDDLYAPDKIKKQVEAIKQNFNSIVACNVDVINHKGKLIKHNSIPSNAQLSPLCYLGFDQTTGLNGCSLLIPRNLFEKYGLFDPKLKVTQDYDMWFRLFQNTNLVVLNDNLVLSRQHAKQGSKTLIKYVDYEVDRLHSKIINKITVDEFKKFIKDEDDGLKFYEQYVNMHCVRSASATAKLYFDYLISINKTAKAFDFINHNVLKNEKSMSKYCLNEIPTKSKKRLLIYNNIWVKGGIERVILKAFEFLKKDYEIYFITFNFSDEHGYSIPSEVKTIQISRGSTYMLPGIILLITKLLDIDLFLGNQNLDRNFILTYEYLKDNNIKSIALNHYNYFLPFNVEWLNNIACIRNKYYNFANLVTWPLNISYLSYSCINNNGYYLPNPNTYECEKKIPKKKAKSILSVARFDDAFKRLDLLLIVFSKVLELDKDIVLTIVGKYDMSKILPNTKNLPLSEFLKKLNIDKDNIIFAGEQSDVKKYYKENELFVFTSETEGFGMVINEAATMGTPTVALNIPGLSDLIVNGKNGYLIEDRNLDEMAKTIVSILNDKEKKEKMQQEALKYVEKFNISNIEKKWNDMINIVINDKKVDNNILPEYKNLILEYEQSILNNFDDNYQDDNLKSSLISKVVYYYKKYGFKKTVKKLIKKIRREK